MYTFLYWFIYCKQNGDFGSNMVNKLYYKKSVIKEPLSENVQKVNLDTYENLFWKEKE